MKTLPFIFLIPLFLVTGCANTQSPAPAQPTVLSNQAAQTRLTQAQSAYDEGQYAVTLSTLRDSSALFALADASTRMAAMKLEAFAYCVAGQVPECRGQFERLLRAFPAFDLSVAERKHPVWGPAFEAAKRSVR